MTPPAATPTAALREALTDDVLWEPHDSDRDWIDSERGVITNRVDLHDHKGGDIDEWPLDLRVREFPVTPLGSR